MAPADFRVDTFPVLRSDAVLVQMVQIGQSPYQVSDERIGAAILDERGNLLPASGAEARKHRILEAGFRRQGIGASLRPSPVTLPKQREQADAPIAKYVRHVVLVHVEHRQLQHVAAQVVFHVGSS